MSRTNRLAINLTGFLLFTVLATGCSLFRSESPTFPETVNLTSERQIGQTFLAHRDGLNGFSVYLTPIEQVPEALTVSLYDSPQAGSPFWTGTVDLPADLKPGWFTLPVETLRSSAGGYYFISIETESENRIKLSTAPANTYPEGALYVNDSSNNRHLEFRLRYSYFWTAVGLLRAAGPAVGLLAAFGFLFTLPGWALFSALWPRWSGLPGHSRWILASGLGLSLYPVLVLWARLVRLELLPYLVWLVPLGAAASFAWRFRKGTWRLTFPALRMDRSALLFYSVLGLVLVTRLLPLRTLDAGMWGDSVHHTLITQLLIDHGGLFSSWEPYAPLITFTYHFGFHTASALLSLLTGAPAHQAVLQMGQLANFLAVAGLVPLADVLLDRFRGEGLTRQQKLLVGTVVVVVAGLLAPIPMRNINWGRYTQLAGQAILVIWMAYSLEYFRSDEKGWRLDLLSWLLLAGLGLTHYRVLIFAVLWIPAYWLFGLRRREIVRAIVRTFRSGYGAALMILPWLIVVFGGKLVAILQFQLTTSPEAAGEALQNYNSVGNLNLYLPDYLWTAFGVAAIWGIARRSKAALSLLLWSGLLLLLANPAWLGLPGTGIVNNFAALLAVYIPAALLCGFGGLWLSEFLTAQAAWFRTPAAGNAAAALVMVVCLWGAWGERQLVNPRSHAMVTRSDLNAYEWVRENVPEDAEFFVNFFAAEGGNTVAGSDGGWWIPYFTGRESVLPPFIMISEVTKPQDLRLELLALNEQVLEHSLDNEGVYQALKQMGVTYLYFGQRQGAVGSQGVFIDPAPLLESRYYQLAYQQDHVWIFALKPAQ